MALKRKGMKKKAKSAKNALAQRAEAEDFEVYAPGSDDADDPEEMGRKDRLTLIEGTTYLVVLPPLKRWKIRKPWVPIGSHFLGADFGKILGYDLPDDIPMVQGCARLLKGEKCGWCDTGKRWKRSRSRRERDLGDALYASVRYSANVVVIKEGKNTVPDADRYPQAFPFGSKIFEPLNAALHDGELLCGPTALTPVRIKREGTGMATRYATKVLTREKEIVLSRKWLEEMADLRDAIPLTPKPQEIREWAEMMLSGSDDDDDLDDDLGSEEDPF